MKIYILINTSGFRHIQIYAIRRRRKRKREKCGRWRRSSKIDEWIHSTLFTNHIFYMCARTERIWNIIVKMWRKKRLRIITIFIIVLIIIDLFQYSVRISFIFIIGKRVKNIQWGKNIKFWLNSIFVLTWMPHTISD